MKKIATLEKTLTTVGMFETFKAILEINGVNLDIARIYVYVKDTKNCIIAEVDIDDLETMLPFFNCMFDNHVEVDFNVDDENAHYVHIVLQ